MGHTRHAIRDDGATVQGLAATPTRTGTDDGADVRALAIELSSTHTPRAAAAIMGTTRETYCSLVAGLRVRRGTLAVVRARIASGEISRARSAHQQRGAA